MTEILILVIYLPDFSILNLNKLKTIYLFIRLHNLKDIQLNKLKDVIEYLIKYILRMISSKLL